MSEWQRLLEETNHLGEGDSVESWFTQVASQMLNGCHLIIGNAPLRIAELEFYYFSEMHPDLFTHRDRLQLECGRWYFHRTRGIYRSGSFKGLDLTFGDGKAFGGILIRSIETPEGTLIDGPSLCVDYLLAKAGVAEVAALDKAIDHRIAWDRESPLYLAETTREERQLFRSARVGLSLKKAKTSSEMPKYILRPYRYLSEPRRITKGKTYLVLALCLQGNDPATIHQLTGCPKQTIQRYIADFEAGQQEIDFAPYFGIDLNSKELCRLHGTWHAKIKTNV